MNVYVLETARRLAERGVEVEVFTRATTGALPEVVEAAPARAGIGLNRANRPEASTRRMRDRLEGCWRTRPETFTVWRCSASTPPRWSSRAPVTPAG
ncbi:MAG TPA: glycosyltransferase, partial [Segeticoccus sp.]|nr:glycosyltransferase [Segeticoccus sp.]